MDNAELRIPESVGIIMDGNGRWAAKRGMPRNFGHKAGCEAVEKIIPDAGELGIKYLTVYAFSTENWKRSEEEVGGLMQLFRYYAERLLSAAQKNNVRIRMIGDRRRFPADIIDSINRLESLTAANTGLNFAMAANYGGRDEIRRAAIRFAEDYKNGLIPEAALCHDGLADHEGEISESGFASYLDTAGMPDPDLIIRTSGELRLSNFLTWQSAYSEIVVTDVYWPDFDRAELINCIRQYSKRSRRFGGV